MSNLISGAEFDMSEHFKLLTCEATTTYSANALGSYYIFLGGVGMSYRDSPLYQAFVNSKIPEKDVVAVVPLGAVKKGGAAVRGDGACIVNYNNDDGTDAWSDVGRTASFALNAPNAATYICRFMVILR